MTDKETMFCDRMVRLKPIDKIMDVLSTIIDIIFRPGVDQKSRKKKNKIHTRNVI